ncbi:sigma 54-interacting transcriptional regulator [Desulfovibrio sp. OttesenSCG-928-A18]|nr:sigma 54-interacting transcriptional regulator [Desulfovibrio sp. OttesenSCG-928-A18]
MLSQLNLSIQSYADVISKVTGIDVEIMDANMVRVAGTGSYAQAVGHSLAEAGEVYKEVLRSRRTVLVESPRHHAICERCLDRENCRERLSLATPIADDNTVYGVIGLVCFNDADRARVMGSLESYSVFISFLADGLAVKIGETDRFNRASHLLDLMLRAVDIPGQGIALFNPDGSLLYCNTPAGELLGVSEGRLPTAGNIQRGSSVIYGYDEYEITSLDGKTHSLPGRMVELEAGADGMVLMFVFELPTRLARLSGDLNSSGGESGFENIIGNSVALGRLKTKAMQVVDSGSTVLITGESGTGKELLARAIHHAGPRKNAPFIAINCGGIPDTLLESELFGYVSGAFTGASSKGRMGKFELAEGGILFLDEISAMPLYVQVKLLRVLQERVIIRLGSNRLVPVQVRIIAASNEDLRDCIRRNTFREDLFYRLNVIPLDIPPLRERKGDVPILADFFLDKYCALFNKRRPKLRSSLIRLLESYHWPGNVRELEHVLEYAVNMMPDSGAMGIDCLPAKLLEEVSGGAGTAAARAAPPANGQTLPEPEILPLRLLEERAIRAALERFGSSTEGKKQAARALGLSLATLYRKMQSFSI